MTKVGANVFGTYSLIVIIGLAIYHTIRFSKKHDEVSELVVTLLIPVLIYLQMLFKRSCENDRKGAYRKIRNASCRAY